MLKDQSDMAEDLGRLYPVGKTLALPDTIVFAAAERGLRGKNNEAGTVVTVLDGIGRIGIGCTILVVERLVAEGKLSAQQFQGVELLLNTMWIRWSVASVRWSAKRLRGPLSPPECS
jgi:hypothetical protein